MGQRSGHRSQPVEGARGSAGGSGLRALGGWPRGSRGGSLSRLQRLQCPVAQGGCRRQLWPAASLEPSRAVKHQLVEVMSDEAEEFAVGPENQMELCGEPESPSLSEEKPSMGLLPMKQDEEGESHSGALSMSVEDNDPKVMATSVLGMMPKKLPLRPVEMNADIKHQLMKEIRQFGRKYERVFTLLDGAQGSLEVRTQYVEFAIKEAARFKRADLIKHLEKLLEQKDSERFLNKGDCTPKI
ncbi:cancer/testis antigen family 45 member A10-like [Camelus ferus]|uniref:Cancer/testis antigen family 45 member A10-like n=2 Tax=Camelus TaxID=9836 RepID=A0A8B8SLJ6_CAMFR|nr:cancer/testis antigen family 45 member A10-like [Camelus ferus]XP_045368807.1 cancer/testis antigen family 45 member A10-like [Camelus bactrianus]